MSAFPTPIRYLSPFPSALVLDSHGVFVPAACELAVCRNPKLCCRGAEPNFVARNVPRIKMENTDRKASTGLPDVRRLEAYVGAMAANFGVWLLLWPTAPISKQQSSTS